MPEEKQVTVELPETVTKALADVEAIKKSLATLEGQQPKTDAATLTPQLVMLKERLAEVDKQLTIARTELQKQLEETTAELTASQAEVVKLHAQRRREKFIKRVQELKSLPGAPADDFAEILDAIEGHKVTDKQFAKLNQLLTSWNTVIEKSKIFEEIGRTEIAAFTGAERRMVMLVKEKQALDPKLSYQKAYAQVIVEQPQLYREYRAEQAQRGGK